MRKGVVIKLYVKKQINEVSLDALSTKSKQKLLSKLVGGVIAENSTWSLYRAEIL